MKFLWTILAVLCLSSTANAGIFGPRVYVTPAPLYYPPVYYYYPQTYYPPVYYPPVYTSPGPIFLDYRNVYQVPGFYYYM